MTMIAGGLDQMQESLRSLADVTAVTLPDDELARRLAEVLRVRASVEELTARLVASAVDRGTPGAAGASSTRAWLVGEYGVSTSDAARLVAEATAHPGDVPATRLELVRTAWAGGAVPAERA